MADQNKKPHRYRKSPGSAELWRKQKRARNAARPKQRWVPQHQFIDGTGHTIIEGGHWEPER
jgi:hypothetical protein